jgi:hypothetical protein
MKACNEIQSLLLDHAYGLLEPHDAEALESHLKDCAGCQQALARTRSQKLLLAAAAKASFPDIQFDEPAEGPATLPLQTRPAPAPFLWGRWAVAAAVLLAVSTIGIGSQRYWSARDQVVLAQANYAKIAQTLDDLDRRTRDKAESARQEITKSQAEVQQLFAARQEKISKVMQAVGQQNLHIALSGPQTIAAGAANDFQVQVLDRARQPAAARLSASIVDKAQRELAAAEVIKESKGQYRLQLPRALPVKPNDDVFLVVRAVDENVPEGKKNDRLTLTEKLLLSGPLYRTQLATDKPMYQPGETVRFRSLTLDQFSFKPTADDLHLIFTLIKPTGEQEQVLQGSARVSKEKDGKPEEILGPDKKPLRGIGAGDYTIDPSAPGGEYTLRVSEASNRFPPQERKFLVNRYEKPRLNKELEFTKKAYGPGEEVVATCKVSRAEGGKPVADKPVTATVRIDGQTYDAKGAAGGPIALRTDGQGGVNVHFRLPAEIARGEATVSIMFQDDANVETIVRPIPIVLKKLQVDFYPEGGELVAGLKNRVYFQVRTTLDKPAELSGRIVDQLGQAVAKVQTFNDPTQPGANQGMGTFEFTPHEGGGYELRIDSPQGIEGKYAVPEVKADGVVLNLPQGVVDDRSPIVARVASGQEDRDLFLGAYCRGKLMAHQRLHVKKGEAAEVYLRPESGIGGVYRVTVYEERPGDDNHRQLLPRAERLMYRAPAERLSLAIKPDKPKYVPGDKATLHITAANEKGKPTPAVVMVAVVDKSIIKLADEKTFRTMPTHFLLTSEVRHPEDLEHSDFLLTDHKSALTALDLLLGTQGWRHFAEQDPAKFRHDQGREADRLLVSIGLLEPETVAPKSTDFDAMHIQEAAQANVAEIAERQARLNQALLKQAGAPAVDPSAAKERQALVAQMKAAESAYVQANAQLQSTAGWLRVLQALHPAIVLGAVVLSALVVVGSLVRVLMRRGLVSLPYFATAAGALAAISIIAVFVSGLPEKGPDVAMAVRSETAAKAARDDERLGEAMPAAERLGRGAAERLAIPGAPQALGGYAGPKVLVAPAPGAQFGRPDLDVPQPAEPLPADKEEAAKDGAFKMNALDRARQPLPEKKGREIDVRRQANVGRFGLAQPAQDWAPLKQFKAPNGPMAGPAGAVGGRAIMGKQDMAFRKVMPIVMPPPVAQAPLVVREYAHVRIHGEQNQRSDFAETLCWQPALVLPGGKADSATFDLCDSVTTFQVLVMGHTADGRLGSTTIDLESRLPFSLEPKLPIEVTSSDKIDVAVGVANNTSERHPVSVRMEARDLEQKGPETVQLDVPADGRARKIFRVEPAIISGTAQVRLFGQMASAAPDSVLRELKVVPDGFPIVGSLSDMLEKQARQDLVLPETWIKGTLRYQVSVYPSTLADLQKGLEAMLREPNGCFEQTSTSNYPNVLILDYLKETNQAKPEVAKRALDLMNRGYQKLVSFECQNEAKHQQEGYEWFGGTAPPHEALTAYGLLQFRDMARVYDVDKTMLERTRAYLMASRDGKGGFKRNARALDSFGRAPDDITNAYIIWALTESGKDDNLTLEIKALNEQAKTSKDPYFLALVANSLLNRDRKDEAVVILQKLVAAQQKDGHLDAEKTSITGSGGRDLQIETTAMALLGWLKAKRPDQFNVAVQSAARWIGQQRGGYGGFGSTQSTILALKALIAFARENKQTPEAGDLVLYLGDREIGRRHFEAGAQDAVSVELADPEAVLKPGNNALRVEIGGKNVFPYTAAWSYRSVKPASAPKAPVGLTTKLDRASAVEGETVHLTVDVANQSGKGQGMTVAIVGLPAGLTLPEDMKQLKDLARLRNNGTEAGPISAWETRGRELVLYWRDMAPDKKVQVSIDLICRVPGEYRGPASRAYLYYNADNKTWAEPLAITISPRGGEQ